MNSFQKTFFSITLAIFITTISSNSYAQIVINEIHYDPDLKTEWVEFVELYNAGDTEIDLSGWSLRNAIEYTFTGQTPLPAGKYLVVGQKPAAIVSKYKISSSLVFGPFVGRMGNENEQVELYTADGQIADRVQYELGFPWPTVGNPIPETKSGTSHSIQLIHPTLDNNLAGSWRSASPTPGAKNSVYSENTPPFIRQVDHSPKQAVSNQTVLITAKVTDPDGVDQVTLRYQIVEPGNYVSLKDGSYSANWLELAMHDDGLEGDAIAGDFIYSVEMPASMQTHRRLIRYRIFLSDTLGNSLMVPYADDPQPNFAYFVYDGVPSWTGAVRPGQTQEITYSSEMLSSIPVYHLISSKEQVEKCTWYDQKQDNEYHYWGTLVYDGVVYDHIQYRARGGVWRYSMGKNMWKFNMNRGHGFQGRDNYGQKYKTKWDKVNLGANIQQGDYRHRGEQGMFESVGFKLFNMAGMEASNTNFVHFRIIDEGSEDGKLNTAHSPMTSSGTQYDGDFWGLYLATEQVDGRFLDEHDLPDGNLYKMENGSGEIRNQSPYGVTDTSDLWSFMNAYFKRPSADWWRSTTDIQRYFNYRTIVEGIHQYDIAYGKNYYYYLNPETNQWFQLPWDLDLTWADNMYGHGVDPFMQYGILQDNTINLDYQNRMREIRDLLYNTDQAAQLIDEYASFIYDPNGESFVDADRAMWDYHWVMSNQAAQRGMNNPGKSGQGMFYQVTSSKDFPGMLNLMKNYVLSRGAWIDQSILSNDQNVPKTPTIKSLSNNYRLDSLTFETSDFSDPNSGDRFAAMKWRIAEVEPGAKAWTPSGGSSTEDPETPDLPSDVKILVEPMQNWKYFKGTKEPSEPRSAWRQLSFDDSAWVNGDAPIGYGENFIQTELADMRGNYTTLYLRKTFTVEDLASIDKMFVAVCFDDGFNLWINGVLVAQDHVTSDDLPFDAVAIHRENLEYVAYELPDPADYLIEGTNVIAIQAINQYLSQSSDFFIDSALLYTEKVEEQPEPEPEPEPEPDQPIQRSAKPWKYEINPIWESDEITVFQKQITIPADKVTTGKTYRIRVKMKDSSGRWSHWSDPIQFVAQQSESRQVALENLRVTELMYNPNGGGEFEFVELHNTSSSIAIDLGGFAFAEGITYEFPMGTILEPNGYLLVVSSSSESEINAFRSYYHLDSSVPLVGPYVGKLSNAGEKLTLKTSLQGQNLIVFEFSDGRGWSLSADGTGHSLVPRTEAMVAQPEGSLDYGDNWRSSAFIGGSPGKADPEPSSGVVLNELIANTQDGDDWIELYNSSLNTIHLSDWYLSDNETDLKKWAIPSIEIAPHSFISFEASTGFNQGGAGFGLSKNGERLLLSYLPGKAEVDRVVDEVRFKAQEIDLSWGRVGDGMPYWSSMTPSRADRNRTPDRGVVIDELMYHPLVISDTLSENSQGEFIELFNTTSQDISLWNQNGPWRLDGGIDFLFPANTSIPAKGRLLLVSFDPKNPVELNAFLSMYSLNSDAVSMIGPYNGNLSNRGERIAVEKLLEIDPTNGSLAWAIVDEMIYFDQAPWDPDADGTGKSLQRLSIVPSSNDPHNWKADSPTPGQESSPHTPVSSWMMY